MRTIRITLAGGPYCGQDYNDHSAVDDKARFASGDIYIRSERRDNENRQVFIHHIKRDSLKLPKQSDLG